MVAKGFLAAAAIIICCSTTLQGKDPEEKCVGGDCPAASSDKQQCSAEGKCCAEGKCNDQEECCEQEQVSLEKCSTEKCSTETCSTGECAKSRCSTEKCAADKCSTEKCSAEKSAAGQCTAGECSGEKCTFSACADGACDSLKCALAGTAKSDCTAGTCTKSNCLTETCAVSSCAAGQCRGASCPVAACAGQVCDALKCALQSCTTASDDDCCPEAVCATGACGTTRCATLECSGQDCPAGECNSAPCSDEVCNGLKCAVGICLTPSGGQLTFTATKSFAGEPASEKCSTEVGTEETCSTTKCDAEKCSKEVCTEGTCVAETCSTSACKSGECAKSACASRTAVVVERPALEVAKATCNASTACSAAKLAVGCSKLETKLAELERLQAEIAALRSTNQRSQMYIVDVKVIEVNKSKCRSLGFDFETAGGNAACEFVGQTLEALMKKNLAHVLFNPTLCVTSDHPASFRAGAEIAPTIDEGKEVSGFVGKKLDVLATPAGDNKVRMHIAPTISELDFAMQKLPKIKTIKWDFACEAILGKPIVLKGADEQRVIAKTIEGREPIEVIEEIETMLIVTVNSLENNDLQAEIKQTAYEHRLVSVVKAPAFVTRVYPVPDLQVWKVRSQGVQFDADLLVAHVKSTVDPQSWRGAVCSSPADAKNANGAIQPFERNGSLVISQTEENHERIARLLQKMCIEGQQKDEAREQRELLDGDVTPASAETPVEQESKCSEGKCSESKCTESKCKGSECTKSKVSLESAPAVECPGDCQGQCDGECPETASCPCIGGTCTR